jgi:hypothetical protein
MSDISSSTSLISRAWYGSSLADFVKESPDGVIGRLSSNSDFAILPTQRDAWLVQIDILQGCLSGIDGSIFLEFAIPRMGRRVDVVLIIGAVLFVMEFKVGDSTF